ncbi:MAG TPA: hypothetical protein VG675_10010 [Bryobacteraceae bacterium]|nr:hypothetical protein [Bryobacteraceae bacterium]
MKEEGTAKSFTRRDERRLLKIATESLRSNFPNPERHGCPGSDALLAIARRQLEFPETDDIVDHIATCSPCFLEYSAHRRRYRLRLVGGTAFCCVAVLLLTVFFWRFSTPPRPRNETIARQSPTAIKAVLDFRNRTVERSERGPSPNEPAAPHLKRARLDLSIKLPVGVEDGLYAVQFRDQRGQSVVDTTGKAAWDGAAETMTTAVDLGNLAPGKYILAIRSATSDWRVYPVVLD